MTRTSKWLFLPIFLLQAAFFLFVSQHRFIDSDEGYYQLASQLVMQHKTVYLDFFYPQAPLLPYAYALWFKLAGVSWFSARAFAALQTAVLGALLYQHVCRETRKWIAGLAAVLLFASSSLIFAWFPIVKTFPLATPFLFVAYMILTRMRVASRSGGEPPSSLPDWTLAIAGFCFAISVDTRSYVIALAPVLVWWIIRQRSPWLRRLLWSLIGFAIGIIPSLALFLASPDAFLFNNLRYHALRSGGSGLIGNWKDKLAVVAATFGGRFTGFQFSALSLTCGFMLVRHRMKRDSALLAFVIAVVLGIVSILPTPLAMQYFSMVVPFLIVAAVCSVSDFLETPQAPREVRRARTICAVAIAAFVLAGVPAFRQYLFTGYKVPGVTEPSEAPNWTLTQVTAVSRAIDQLSRPGEPVIAFWPGYVFGTHATPYPGFEDHFGIFVAGRLSEEQRAKYHLLTGEDMDEILHHQQAPLVVIGNQGPWVGGPDYDSSIAVTRRSGYRLVKVVGDTAIFQRPGLPSP